MRILLLLAIFLKSQAYGVSFFEYSPEKRTIKGVDYPRNGLTQYRGTTKDQMSLKKALNAMFGDKSAYLESFFFTKVKNSLMNKTTSFSYKLTSFIEDQIEIIINNNGAPLDRLSATNEAKKLVDQHFNYRNSRYQNWSENTYINFRHSDYIDWPREAVYSSIVSPAAATYGDRVVVINEKEPRSIDMNYWNYINHGQWFHATRDAGEFIAPGYIPPTDITGYEIRTRESNMPWQKRWWNINYAFYLEYVNGEPIVLVFDGKSKSCALKNKNNEYVFCKFKPSDKFADGPRPATSEGLPIIGVITNDKNINISEIYNRDLIKSEKKLPSWILDRIKSSNLFFKSLN